MRSTKILRTLGIMAGLVLLIFAVVIPSISAGHLAFQAGAFGPMTATFLFAAITDEALAGMGVSNDGEENMGGYGMLAYIALRSHLASYPTVINPEDATTLEELCLLQGNYGFLTDKYFIKIEVAPESLFVNPVSQGGSPGTNSFSLSGGFTINGFSGKHRGLARILNNCYGVLVIPNDDGTRTAYGNELRPISFKSVKGDSGKKAADAKKFDFEFITDSFVPGYTYEGTIPLDGVILPAVS